MGDSEPESVESLDWDGGMGGREDDVVQGLRDSFKDCVMHVASKAV